jgi:uncharacterized protein YukE
MAQFNNQVDLVGVQNMVDAFDTAMADCNAAQMAIDSTQSFVTSNWVGGASDRYINALQAWENGLGKVKGALELIRSQMEQFGGSAHSVEEYAIDRASWTA